MHEVDMVLRGAHKFAGTLLDDMLLFSSDFDQHLGHVKDELDRQKCRLNGKH